MYADIIIVFCVKKKEAAGDGAFQTMESSHYKRLQRTSSTHCPKLQRTASSHCKALRHTADHTLQHAATG